MTNLTPQQKRKLQKLADVLDNGNVAVLEHLFELEETLDDTVEKLESKIPDVTKILETIRGVDGDQGEQGEKGETGIDGKDGRDGVDGKNGKDGVRGDKGDKGDSGKNGRDGVDGKDGIDGKDGADGFIDESVVAYLEDKIDTVAKSATHTNFGMVVREIQAGSNVTVDNTDPNRPIVTANLPEGSGIIRSVISTSGNANMAATAGTDYVYIVTGAHTMTLPTAVGSTNLYTVRNNHSANITVNTTSSQDIKGSVTATSYSVFSGDSRSFISDGVGWNIV